MTFLEPCIFSRARQAREGQRQGEASLHRTHAPPQLLSWLFFFRLPFQSPVCLCRTKRFESTLFFLRPTSEKTPFFASLCDTFVQVPHLRSQLGQGPPGLDVGGKAQQVLMCECLQVIFVLRNKSCLCDAVMFEMMLLLLFTRTHLHGECLQVMFTVECLASAFR